MSWDERWMSMAQLIAMWSKDNLRKVGAVIVDERNVLVAIGWNGMPRGVNDDIVTRHLRPNKYMWFEHAERNAFYNAAANGFKCTGCKMYIPWYPCAPCARAIIQAGISELICVEPDWKDESYAQEFSVVKEMLAEVSICVRFVDWIKAPERRDG